MNRLVFTLFLCVQFAVGFVPKWAGVRARSGGLLASRRYESSPDDRAGDTEGRGTRRFPISKTYYENYLKRLNSNNHTIRDSNILGDDSDFYRDFDGDVNVTTVESDSDKDSDNYGYGSSRRRIGGRRRRPPPSIGGIRIIIGKGGLELNGDMDGDGTDNELDPEGFFGIRGEGDGSSRGGPSDEDDNDDDSYESFKRRGNKKSDNFEVLNKFPIRFKDVGGYESVKDELMQCVDILKNYTKYSKYNIRMPRGLILEGPPGNGKTLLAKAFAGEANVGFIPVSGSQFQEKYVGVGSNRVRELFQLAAKNSPCIIFIDEIDAIGRKRSSDGESSSNERDNTLNELLVQLDGFHNFTGVFIIGATNRIDLLDPALVRPGRIDKKIFIGLPNKETREKVLNIHIRGKPYNKDTVTIDNVLDMTDGFSCAQIENLLNEAMLNSLRHDRHEINMTDIESVMNKIMVGWEPEQHAFDDEFIDRISVHEMGHVMMGMISKNHPKVRKVLINLHSPNSPGYTVFDRSTNSPLYTKESLFEHLMILLSGRIAEEIVFGVSVTTGAINDFEEALKLAEKMVMYYGMGENLIYPHNSEKYKKKIDDEVAQLIKDAYAYASFALRKMSAFIRIGADRLKSTRILYYEDLDKMIQEHDETRESVMLLKDKSLT
jgi:cell division protease FtsH